MTILITGATGFVGSALTLRLRRDGHAIAALVRDPQRGRQRLGADVDLVDAKSSIPELAEVLESCDAVVNLAGSPVLPGRWTRRKKRRLRESRVGITEELVEALAVCSERPRTLISASAVGFYGDRGAELLDEDSERGSGFLAELCGDWEAAALAARELGLRVVLARIGLVLGVGGGVLDAVHPVFRAGLGGHIGDGHQFVPWIHIDDAVEALVRMLDDDRFDGPVNVVAPSPVTSETFAASLARAVDRPAAIAAPVPALRAVLGEAATALLSSQRVLPGRLMDGGFSFRFADLPDALDQLLRPSGVAIERAEELPDSEYIRGRKPRYQLSSSVLLDAPIDEVFEFFETPDNLGALTPPSMSFRLATPTPIEMRAGTVIDHHIRLGPVPMPWRTVIEHYERGRLFIDAQHRGPYASWWHEHRFTPIDGRTLVQDRVLYAPPLGPLGWLANRWLVAPMLRRVFHYRAQAMRRRFGAAEPGSTGGGRRAA